MIQITMGNCYSKILGCNSGEEDIVDKVCSYRPEGYYFMGKYKTGEWDGRIRLYRWNTFPTGLLGLVTKELRKNVIKYILYDARKKPKKLINIKLKRKLRDYQRKVREQAIDRERGVLWIPTGAGKTLLATGIIAQLGVKTLYIVHTKDLMYQTQKMLSEDLGVKIGILGDGKVEIENVTVGMIQTLYSQSKKYKEYFSSIGCLIFDEAHHSQARSWQRVALKIPAFYRYAMSGSPYRGIEKDILLRAITGKIIVQITSSELIEKGYLVSPVIKMIEVDSDTFEGDEYREVYRKGIMENEKRNLLITSYALDRAYMRRMKVLVLVTRIEHGKLLEKSIKGSKFIHGKKDSKERTDALEDFRKGKIKVLIGSTILDEGIDVCSINTIILAGGGLSDLKTIQRIGRCLRPFKGKKEAYVIDFYDRGNKILRGHSRHRLALYRSEPAFKLVEER